MKKQSFPQSLGSSLEPKNQQRKAQSFWKFLCPCLCTKKSKNDSDNKQIQSYRRQQFYQQKTQNQEDLRQQTQYNLPLSFKETSYLTKPKEKVKKNIQQIQLQQTNLQANKDLKIIKFNVKRTSNFSHHQNSTKNRKMSHQGKQNSKPQIKQSSEHSIQRSEKTKAPIRFTDTNQQKKAKKTKNIIEMRNNHRMGIIKEQLLSIEKHLQQMDGLADYEFLQNWQESYENHYPINQFQENKLNVLGDKTNKILTKITSVNLFPSSSALERFKDSIRSKKLNQNFGHKDIDFNSHVDKYWDKRYFLFQKFDEGIKLDQESWYSVTPEAVADYISSKVNLKETILDAFCGAGGDSIKLAMSCKNVISNDIDELKLKCLSNNAKVYDVNNISISHSNFFNLNCKVGAVYLAPPWGGPDYYKIQSFHPESFEPKLSQIIEKAFTLSSNIFFLLPANTDVSALGSIICEKLRKVKDFIPESCSLKLQKIYFNERLKFIAGFYGNCEVQNQIKLSDELSFIYNLFDQSNKIFKHKKLIRRIRQEYGMVNLLNFVYECEKQSTNTSEKFEGIWKIQQLSMIEKFQKFLVNNKIIDGKILQKIMQQQKIENQYQLKKREKRNSRLKNKKIQKHKQKQEKSSAQSHPSHELYNHIKSINQQKIQPEVLKIEQNSEIPIFQIINQANHSHLGRYQMVSTINSKISSQNGFEQTQQVQTRESIRTVSLASEFHEEQLQNITHHRLTTQSDISNNDSINPLKTYDNLDISFNESSRISYESMQKQNHSDQKKNEQNSKQHRSLTTNMVFSPSENFKMKKVKIGSKWQKGITQQINQDLE